MSTEITVRAHIDAAVGIDSQGSGDAQLQTVNGASRCGRVCQQAAVFEREVVRLQCARAIGLCAITIINLRLRLVADSQTIDAQFGRIGSPGSSHVGQLAGRGIDRDRGGTVADDCKRLRLGRIWLER